MIFTKLERGITLYEKCATESIITRLCSTTVRFCVAFLASLYT